MYNFDDGVFSRAKSDIKQQSWHNLRFDVNGTVTLNIHYIQLKITYFDKLCA